MIAVSKRDRRRKRVPKLAYADNRAIGWHVSFRDAAMRLPRKHRFGDVAEESARVLYHQWVAEDMEGKTAPRFPAQSKRSSANGVRAS